MISIIIPVLNEAENIESLIDHLAATSSSEHISEIIIVDGGSTDETQNLVRKYRANFSKSTSFPKICLLESDKGRAKQMNVGAKRATAKILYFLHADSFPPNNFDSLIIEEVKKDNEAGCFRMKFDHSHWWLRLAGWLTRFKSKTCRGGDQSQFITKQLFYEIGGFNEQFTIYEDYILITELYKRGEFVVIPHWLTTSARRYETKGIWRLQYHFWAIYVKKFFGADAHELFRYYEKNIAS